MRIEWIIALYLLVSVMMILFNFGFLAYEKLHARRFDVRTKRFAELLGQEIERNAEFPTDEHKRTLERAMHRMAGMESFDLTMERLVREGSDKSERYLHGIAAVFGHLTYYFAKKDDLHRAYFAYIVKRWYRERPAGDMVEQALLHSVREGSFYARQNALEALAQVGSARALAEAIATLERDGEFHSPKLVTEAALAFAGEPTELEDELEVRLARFGAQTRAALVNYLRMAGLGDPDRVLALLRDGREGLEVRLACIRYFMRRHWPPAEADLIKLAADDDPARWEYAAVAATALTNYPSMKAVEVLKGCLSSPSWFVRNNAAKTLYGYGLSLEDLADVLDGSDAFARDMVTDHWELKRLEEEERERAKRGQGKEAEPA